MAGKKRKKAKCLTPAEYTYIEEYIRTNNAITAYKKAYPELLDEKQSVIARRANNLRKRILVAEEIRRRQTALNAEKSTNIATGQEVMQYLTDVMNGRIKDQFGLDAPLSERTKAAQELAKRTVDFDNRNAGKADANIKITLDWSR